MATKKASKPKQKKELEEEKVKKTTTKSKAESKSATKKMSSKAKKAESKSKKVSKKETKPKAKPETSKKETKEVKQKVEETKKTEEPKKAKEEKPKKKNSSGFKLLGLSPIFSGAIAVILSFALIAGIAAAWFFTSSEYAYKQFITAYENEEYEKALEYIDTKQSIQSYQDYTKQVYLEEIADEDEETKQYVTTLLENVNSEENVNAMEEGFRTNFLEQDGVLEGYPTSYEDIFTEKKKFDSGYGYPSIVGQTQDGKESIVYFIFEREGLGWKVKSFRPNEDVFREEARKSIDAIANRPQGNLEIQEPEENPQENASENQ